MNQKRISHSLTKKNSLKKTTLALILLSVFALGLTFFVQPAQAFSVNILSHSGYLDIVGGYWVYGEIQNLDTTPIRGVG